MTNSPTRPSLRDPASRDAPRRAHAGISWRALLASVALHAAILVTARLPVDAPGPHRSPASEPSTGGQLLMLDLKPTSTPAPAPIDVREERPARRPESRPEAPDDRTPEAEEEGGTLARMRVIRDPRLVASVPSWRDPPPPAERPAVRSALAACHDSLSRAERRRSERNTLAVEDRRGRRWGIVDGGVVLGGVRIAVEMSDRRSPEDRAIGALLPRYDPCEPLIAR